MSSNTSTTARHIHVSCAIIERDGLVLVTRRSASMSMPNKWEFPGGKIKPGETPEVCLCRELQEELGIQVGIRRSLPASLHQYPAFTITLYPFVCMVESGDISLYEHAAMAWLGPGELSELDWTEADVPVLTTYLAERR